MGVRQGVLYSPREKCLAVLLGAHLERNEKNKVGAKILVLTPLPSLPEYDSSEACTSIVIGHSTKKHNIFIIQISR